MFGAIMIASASQKRLIAICGKGGSGKTALVALLAKHLIQSRRHRLLVIDADPTMNLAPVLGIETGKTINDIREGIIKEARSAKTEEKYQIAHSLDYMLLEALTETRHFSFLVMGRPDSVGCYCPVNDLLRDGIKTLTKHFDAILIDGEAGVEQISRQVIRSVDTTIVVSDMSMRGLQTAALIRNVIEAHKIIKFKKMGLVLNRVRGSESMFDEHIAQTGLELLGRIPEDDNIEIAEGENLTRRNITNISRT